MIGLNQLSGVARTTAPPFPLRSTLRRTSRPSPQKTLPQTSIKASTNNTRSVVTDANVPEGHKNLHGFLYGEGGAEVHDDAHAYNFRKDEDDGSTLLAVESFLESRDGEKPLGVFALYDTDHNVQYVGYSRNVVLTVKTLLGRVGEERCAFVRVMVFMNEVMATRDNLQREAQNWIDNEGTIPPGNGVEKEIWEGSRSKDPGVGNLSGKGLAEYEDKKLKMRKAMGENLHDDVKGESIDMKERRLRMIKAVEGDDWSEVIDEQTQETLEGSQNPSQNPSEQIVSPFARARVHRSIGNVVENSAEMSVDAVDKALDEVRPYLMADGGNVDVVGVEDGIVRLKLQGACGTCPSSTATMKMGIERALKATFGDQVKDVVQVDAQDTSASVPTVDEHLNLLRPAIQGYGGEVEVLQVGDGLCKIKFKGPKPIGMGIRAAIKDKFPDIKEVELIDWE